VDLQPAARFDGADDLPDDSSEARGAGSGESVSHVGEVKRVERGWRKGLVDVVGEEGGGGVHLLLEVGNKGSCQTC